MSDEARRQIVRLWQRVKLHTLHYFVALVASSWNAGIAALVVSLGMAAGAAVDPEHIQALNWPQMYAAFKYGAIINAIFYLRNHPLPEKIALNGDTRPPIPT